MRNMHNPAPPRKRNAALSELLLEPLEQYIDQKIAEAFAARGVSAGGERVDLSTALPSKRACYAAARSGEIVGAERIKRTWYAPRASYEQWLASIAVRPTGETTDPSDSPNNLDALRERLGLRIVGGANK